MLAVLWSVQAYAGSHSAPITPDITERNTTMRIMTRLAAAAGLTMAAAGWGAQAQAQTDQDHSAHHPGGAPEQTAQATPGTSQAPGANTPGMMGGQGMMQGMPTQGMPGMMGGDMGRMMEMMEMMRTRMAAQAAMRPLQHVEGELAYYRTELGITDAQQPQWNAFADAIRASAQKLRQAYGQAMQQATGQPAPVPAQLERRIATLSVLLETTRSVAAAAGPLYAALSDQQKRTADELLAEHLHDMRGHGL
jgi:hypothetical protein